MSAPAWMPSPAAGVAVLAAGVWWDAVRVPLGYGMALTSAMERPAPVIRNLVSTTLSWLVPVGSAAEWSERPAAVDLIGAGRRLAVPAASERWESWSGGPAISWRIPPPPGQSLTTVAVLRAAVARMRQQAAEETAELSPG